MQFSLFVLTLTVVWVKLCVYTIVACLLSDSWFVNFFCLTCCKTLVYTLEFWKMYANMLNSFISWKMYVNMISALKDSVTSSVPHGATVCKLHADTIYMQVLREFFFYSRMFGYLC
jgi:hypothetical protein